ncbi:hypothetical protein [uncultured Erythrobacter sp.]|uniref:hypothetical protein n=1 Tax=uncultured Erythrobacter sp. TaxID=263913 RepID=UPI002625A306|nr:hypothetical protein [uncultured Erythrobacter sp.]
MTKLKATCAAAALLVLTACGNTAEQPSSNTAEDFAARINGGQQSAQGTVEPTIAQPKQGAAPGPYTPGTQTDPNVTCGANVMGPYIGQVADEATRSEIMGVIAGTNEVRFISPGGDFIRPDPTHPRLNLMLDATGVIRDARCG